MTPNPAAQFTRKEKETLPAQRTYGMDQDFYPWSPIVTRPVLRWPDNARVALAVIVNLEHWDWEVPAGTPLAGEPDGRPRGPVDRQPAGTFPISAATATTNTATGSGFFAFSPCWTSTASSRPWRSIRPSPTTTRSWSRRARSAAPSSSRTACRAGGSSISACPKTRSAQYIRASIEAVEKATGKRPIGWSGPDFQETPNTPNLLAAEGIRYVCDWGNDEQPYKMTPKTGELYSLGVNAYLDDNYIHLHGRRTINEVNLLWRDWFDGLYADGATTGRLMVLHLHPWIMGQPWRIRHLDEVLGHICARQGVWKATGGEIIDWFKAQSG